MSWIEPPGIDADARACLKKKICASDFQQILFQKKECNLQKRKKNNQTFSLLFGATIGGDEAFQVAMWDVFFNSFAEMLGYSRVRHQW